MSSDILRGIGLKQALHGEGKEERGKEIAIVEERRA